MSPPAKVFPSFGVHESCGEVSAVAELVATTHIYARDFCVRESQSRDAQESMASSDQASLRVWNVSTLGPRIQRTR